MAVAIPRFIGLYRNGRLPLDRQLDGHPDLDAISSGFDRLAGPQVIQNILWLFGCGASRRSLTRASRS